MSLVLFRRWRRVGLTWALGFVVFIVLLPNAAYVLTDVIHLPRMVRGEHSHRVVVVFLLPMFATLFTLGFAAYVDALRRFSRFVVDRGWLQHALVLEVTVHAVSSVAIYAGRTLRYNSWDLLTRPSDVVRRTLDGFTRPAPIAGMFVTF